MNFETMTNEDLIEFVIDKLIEFEGNDLEQAVMWIFSQYPNFPCGKTNIELITDQAMRMSKDAFHEIMNGN